MNLTKNQILSLFRELVGFLAAVLAAYGVTQVGGFNMADVLGFGLYAAVTIWGVLDKTNKDASALWSLIRKGISMGGAFVMFYFPETSKFITVLIPALLAMLNIFSGVNASAPVNQTKI